MIRRLFEGIGRGVNDWEVRIMEETEIKHNRLTLRYLEGGTISVEEYWRRVLRLPRFDTEPRLRRDIKKIKRM